MFLSRKWERSSCQVQFPLELIVSFQLIANDALRLCIRSFGEVRRPWLFVLHLASLVSQLKPRHGLLGFSWAFHLPSSVFLFLDGVPATGPNLILCFFGSWTTIPHVYMCVCMRFVGYLYGVGRGCSEPAHFYKLAAHLWSHPRKTQKTPTSFGFMHQKRQKENQKEKQRKT